MSRRFKVLDSSGLGFGIRFDGMVLDYVCKGYPHAGSITLQQPPKDINGKFCIGTVTFDKEHVEEVEDGDFPIVPEQHQIKRKYNVGISRSYTHTGSVIVIAKSSEEAGMKAIEQINDIELKLGELIPGTDDILYVEEVK